ncbi:hypothetical protein R69746_06352 [Paraburkholderia aspalathi]|nr:hypothetical protein R69746_06352 [Paraburkholderia aspalathi]CAE6870196.1 hypothetical protein R75465_08231 [Paraburkholderia aspalathi]
MGFGSFAASRNLDFSRSGYSDLKFSPGAACRQTPWPSKTRNQLRDAVGIDEDSVFGTLWGAIRGVRAPPQYTLSKRTDIYLIGIWDHARGIDSTGNSAVANVITLSAYYNANQLAVTEGIIHKS